MSATTPEQAQQLFVQNFNAGNIEGLISLYEPSAILVPFPGEPVSGQAAIREALNGFLALKGQMHLTIERSFRADDIALLFSTWVLNGTDPAGNAIELTGQTSDVVRRQADGSWLFVIDNPQGAAAATKPG
jgi:uncharacterized protein (TIGR02246 family)